MAKEVEQKANISKIHIQDWRIKTDFMSYFFLNVTVAVPSWLTVTVVCHCC